MVDERLTQQGDACGTFYLSFCVCQDGFAYSSVWRVWAHANKPDLYIAVRQLTGEIKASVHAPHPPHPGWRRHLGFQKDATSIVSQTAKQQGGPHKVRWTGYEIGQDTTLEYRVIIRAASLEETGKPVDPNEVVLLPMPSPNHCVEACVILGPKVQNTGPPRDRDEETYLIAEGRLWDDRCVWVVYVIRPLPEKETTAPIQIPLENWFIDPEANLTNIARLRAVTFHVEPDGSLGLVDRKVTWRPST
jgi:hypothetical protein